MIGFNCPYCKTKISFKEKFELVKWPASNMKYKCKGCGEISTKRTLPNLVFIVAFIYIFLQVMKVYPDNTITVFIVFVLAFALSTWILNLLTPLKKTM